MKISCWVGCCLPVLVGAGLVLSTADQVTFNASHDEGYYLAYATTIAQDGVGGFRGCFQEYLRYSAQHQYFPSPLRLTTILLDALAVRLEGPSFRSLQHLSLLAFLILLVLVFDLVRRTFSDATAFLTVLLLATSPLHLAMARRALSDSLLATLMVACLGLCFEALRSSTYPLRRLGVIAGMFTVALLARESMVILIPIALTLICVWTVSEKRPVPLGLICAVSIVPLTFSALLAVAAAGTPTMAWRTLVTVTEALKTNQYAMQFGQGPWFRYVLDYLLLSPWTTLLYLLWLGALLGTKVRDSVRWYWALIPILFVGLSAPATKNVRYALLLETPLRLGAVLFLQQTLRNRQGQHRTRVWVTLAVLGIACYDVQTFQTVVVQQHLYDPVSFRLLQGRHIVPREAVVPQK